MAGQRGITSLGQLWKAITELNPESVRQEIRRTFTIGVAGEDHAVDAIMSWLTEGDNQGLSEGVVRKFRPGEWNDIVICASYCSPSSLGINDDFRLFLWNHVDPAKTINDILRESQLSNIHMAMAYRLPAVRKVTSPRIISDISLENAVFVASTSIGTVIPSPLAPFVSLAEAAGDLVVLTANQIRMLFRLAAINGKPVGYRELSPQITSILAAAFGWRALAREFVGLIPFGGGLVAKTAVAYAGTWAVGQGIMLYITTGQRMTREEMRATFERGLESARRTASAIVESLRGKVESSVTVHTIQIEKEGSEDPS